MTRLHTSWPRLVSYALVTFVAAGFLAFVDPPGLRGSTARLFEWPFDVIFAATFSLEGIRLVHLGLHRPRLTIEARGLTDHSTGRGLLLWSDFHDVSLAKPYLGKLRFPTIRLHSTAEVCWHYNQRVPAWRRFSGHRWLGSRSIAVRIAAIDQDAEWIEAEIARRLDLHSP